MGFWKRYNLSRGIAPYYHRENNLVPKEEYQLKGLQILVKFSMPNLLS